jgi:hypothetical protein
MSTQQQPAKGSYTYSLNMSKWLFVDEFGRILDPESTKIPLPPRVVTKNQNQTQTATIQKGPWIEFQENGPTMQTQPQTVPQRPRTALVPAPAPVPQRPTTVNTAAPVPQRRRPAVVAPAFNPAPAPVPRRPRTVVAPMNTAAPAPQRPRPAVVAPAYNPAPVPQRPRNRNNRPVAPAPPAPKPQSNDWSRVRNTRRTPAPAAPVRRNAPTRTQRTPSRGTRSASVSSSGSSVRSRSKSTFNRYPSYFLNRQAVVRSGPSLNTRVKENLDAGTEITTDEVHIRTIWYNFNQRKRIKIVKPIVGWVTVETEQGKLYGRKH